jgi:phage terminase small subunit
LAFVATGNASEAYRRAYSAKRMSAKTVHECASRLLTDRKVSARVAELRAKAADKAVLTLDKHLATLAELRDVAKKAGQMDAAIRAEKHRGEAAGLYPDRSKALSLNLSLPGKSEPVSETTRWVSELTGRDVTQQ